MNHSVKQPKRVIFPRGERNRGNKTTPSPYLSGSSSNESFSFPSAGGNDEVSPSSSSARPPGASSPPSANATAAASHSEHMFQLSLLHPLCADNVTAYVGQTAKMYCCLARLDRELSVRTSDSPLLFAGCIGLRCLPDTHEVHADPTDELNAASLPLVFPF